MKLFSYQQEALEFLVGRKSAGIFYEQGLGKTLVILSHLKSLGEDALPALVVCPLSGVGVWGGEVEKFGFNFKVVNLIGTKQKRAQKLGEDADIYVINIDGLRVMENHLLRKKWKTIVIDESHRIKHRGTKQTCVATKLCMATERKYLLTGTPVPNSPEDIWSQMHVIAPGYLGNFYAFCARYIDYKKINVPIGKGRYREVRKARKFKNLEELRERLSTHTMRKTKAECLDIPEKIYKVIKCYMKPEQKKHYWSLRTSLATELNEKQFKLKSASAVIQKLQQVCQGFIYNGDIAQHFESGKWSMLKDLMQDIGKEHMIIFTWYRYDAEFLAKALTEAGYDVIEYDGKTEVRIAKVKEFQDSDRPKIFLSNIEKAKEAITLTKATSVIYYGNSWNYGSRIQSEDRCVLEGQKVLTPNGFIKIEELKVGDEVINSRNRATKIKHIWSKQIRDKACVEIKCKRWNETIRLTEDHLIRVFSGDSKVWKKANNISLLDRIVTPTHRFVRFDKGQIGFYFDEDCKLKDRSHIKKNDVPSVDKYDFTDDFLFAVGYFAGDGFSSTTSGKGRFVSFSGNNYNKVESLKMCERWAKSVGMNVGRYESGRSVEIRAYGYEWAHWFRKHFGHFAKNKRLPSFVFNLSRENAQKVLDGLVKSDGYVRDGRYEYVTASNALSANVCRLLFKLGLNPCVTKNSTGQFVIGWTEGTEKGLKVVGLKHSYIKKSNLVYDIEVEKGKSFVVGLGVVHNCHRIGTKHSVVYYDFVVPNTVDEVIYDTLKQKGEMADRITGDTRRLAEMICSQGE